MPPEPVAHGRKKAVRKGPVVAGLNALKQRSGNNRGGNIQVDRFADRPSPLAGVGHEGRNAAEVRILFQRVRRQIQQPGPNHASVTPYLRDSPRVQIETVASRQDREPLRIRLHHAVLNAVVHHFREMARPGRPDMRPAFRAIRRQRVENRRKRFDSLCIPARHQAIPFRKAPDAPADPRIDQVQAAFLHGSGAPNRIAIIGIAAVDHDVACFKQRRKRSNGLVHRRAGGHHHPDAPGRGAPVRQGFQRICDDHAGLLVFRNDLGRKVESNDAAAMPQKPKRHIAPHFPQPDHANFHIQPL